MKPSLIIDRELAQAVVNYLSGRPYAEVAVLIDKMLKLPPYALAEKEDGDDHDGVQ